MKEIFRRVEKKYVLSSQQKEELLAKIENRIVADSYGPSTICNIYYDTIHYDLIRNSMDKPLYKEKVRLRSYNVPKKDSKVFLEIKKKYDGVVYKRRIVATLEEIEAYLEEGEKPKCNEQILQEIEYCFQHYKLEPMLFLAYDRVAFFERENEDFRITFDTNVVARDYDLRLESGIYGNVVYDKDAYIMEVKSDGGMPMWFVKAINDLKIYPCSFSKYGKVYSDALLKKREKIEIK